jgi:hypothetical protein
MFQDRHTHDGYGENQSKRSVVALGVIQRDLEPGRDWGTLRPQSVFTAIPLSNWRLILNSWQAVTDGNAFSADRPFTVAVNFGMILSVGNAFARGCQRPVAVSLPGPLQPHLPGFEGR